MSTVRAGNTSTSAPPVERPAVPAPGGGGGAGTPRATRRRKLRTPLAAHGEPMLWLTGGSRTLCVLMVVALIALVLREGLATFWPAPLERIVLLDGSVHLGEVTRSEWYRPGDAALEHAPPDVAERLRTQMAEHDGEAHRRLLRTGNFELTDTHYVWIDDAEIAPGGETRPPWALVVERLEWGRFYGTPARFLIDGNVVADAPEEAWSQLERFRPEVEARRRRIVQLDKDELGVLRREREHARLDVRVVELEHELPAAWVRAYRDARELRDVPAAGEATAPDPEAVAAAARRLERIERNVGRPDTAALAAFDAVLDAFDEVVARTEARNAEVIEEIGALSAANARYAIVMATAGGQEKAIGLDEVTRVYPANRLGAGGKLGVYLSRWWEFLTAEPREANSAGGVFPAIVGTVLMTLIMAVLVVPFGVMAALYLREYAKAGVIVSAVRIAINNLAGVPSIVFGVFGLGFFCYGVGGFIDGGPSWSMPKPAWFALLGGLVLLAALGFATLLAGLRRPGRPDTPGRRVLRIVATTAWLACSGVAVLLVATTPFFDGFFRASLPNPTFGKGALVWASFTLALLTLPVVIVATEEALAAVPNSMREGSYACGASQWQTIKRIVLPRAMPGIMTGTILAMARGAGEVAPLMLVGAVKLVGELPVSASPAENFGVNRSFMHLGFHIYDLGFQSQNSEAAKPLVFTTTLLLIAIIAVLDLAAVFLRSRLRRRFVGSQF